MVTREEFEAKVKLLVNAGFTEDFARKSVREQVGEPEEPKPKAQPLVEEAKRLGARVEGVVFEDEVDIQSFQRGGMQYYPPSEAGTHLSKLVEVITPVTKENQRWFTFETCDEKLRKQGRGIVAVDLRRGAFKLKDILDKLEIPYEVNENRVKYSISFPITCKTYWEETTLQGRTQLRIQDVYHKDWEEGEVT